MGLDYVCIISHFNNMELGKYDNTNIDVRLIETNAIIKEFVKSDTFQLLH